MSEVYTTHSQQVLHLIPGISGSGKTTTGRHVVDQLRANGVGAKLVTPHTTRPQRNYETDGVDYYFHTLQEFENDYLPACDDPSSDWAVSRIGGHFYFNSQRATSPSTETPISILPVAFSAYDEVVAEHTQKGVAVSVLPIAISDTLAPQWLSTLQPMRPTRNLEQELVEQEVFLSGYKGDVFYPEWQPTDFDAYYRRTRTLMDMASVALTSIIEREAS